MKKRRFPMPVRFLLFVPILVTLLVVAQGTPGQVQAQWTPGEREAWGYSNHFACWTSGPISKGEHNWGMDEDEFVIDRDDLGDDARFNTQLNTKYFDEEPHRLEDSELIEPEGLSDAESTAWIDSHSVYTLFDSVPELVDYAFALDVFDNTYYMDRLIFDRRVRMLADQFVDSAEEYNFGTGEDHRMLLPWHSKLDDAKGEYLRRRTVGAYYRGVKSLAAEWIDPANPDGGREVDSVALARDQASNWLEGVEGTITTAGDGGVSHYGTTEGIGQQVSFQTTSTCGTDGVCVEESNYLNDPVAITLHSNIRAQNDGEIDRNTTVKDSRRIMVMDGSTDAQGVKIAVAEEYEFDPGNIAPSTVRSRDAHEGGYSRMHQKNTSSDELRISLVLKDKYRRDIENYQPDMSNLGYSARGLPAMGFRPWTYVRVLTGRPEGLNDWFSKKERRDQSVKHLGYRQPGLDRPARFHDGSGGLTRMPSGLGNRWDPTHIRWPVNFEDLNWYLYALPTDGFGESLWLYWLTREATQKVVFSAYGREAISFPVDSENPIPLCEQPEEYREYPGVDIRPPLNATKIDCTGIDLEWDFKDEFFRGDQREVHLPLDVSDAASEAHLLGPNRLVKQGVERAADASDPKGTRNLNRFDFSILESQPMGDSPPEEDGYLAERFYGIPQDADAQIAYVDAWRSARIDPNMPHLLVFTFYEVWQGGDLKFQIGLGKNHQVEMFKLPKRRIRRVICRAMIHPSGFSPSTGQFGSVAGDIWGAVISFVDDQMEQLGGWLVKILAAISELPLRAGVKSSELACGGLAKLDDLTSLGDVSGPVPPALVDREGRIRVNAATASKLEGSKRCHRISSPPVSTCERDADQILQGKCVRLPEFKLNIRTAEFIRPPEDGVVYNEYRVEVPADSYYVEHGERDFVSVVDAVDTGEGFKTEFHPVADLTSDSPPELNNRNRGLTRVYLDWDLRWDATTNDVYDRVDGFALILHPDQKSVPFPVPETGLPFALPKWLSAQFPDHEGGYIGHTQVDGLAVGGLSYYPPSSDGFKLAGEGSDSLAHWPAAQGAENITVVSSAISSGHYNSFNNFVHNMPLAPGFTHGFQVAPYVGVPGDPAFRMGPLSEKLWLRGDDVACDTVTGPEEDVDYIRDLYDCRGGGARVNIGYTDDEFRPGLLALTGTDICDDIFSSTPAGFTWDNPVVKKVWGLMWIIAGALLFTLLVWQGLRMTYDIWLDPQPAIGFRELVPRFLMAVLLAWGSLVICRLVLVVASDLTCFVAQFTGMSMWGAVGVTFGSLVDGFMAWYGNLDKLSTEGLLFLLSNFLVIFAFGFIVLLVLLYLLYLFVKVFLAMLMRIALLAVLVALSPLAFAFYASDATAHWTKRWLSIFLGTTFQQVVVLLVIYIGISMIGDYFSSGSETGLTSLLVGMLLAFLTLSLASAVPDIVNPGGKGLFNSFTQMGGMALAAGMVIASAGVGAVAGGMAAAGRDGGAGGGAGPIPGGPGSGGGPGITGSGSGGGSGLAPAAPAGSGGMISSVNRSSMGSPAAGPAVTGGAVTGSPAAGPAVTGGAVTGSPAAGPAVTGGPVTGSPDTGSPDTGAAVTGSPATGSATPGSPDTVPTTPGPSAPQQRGPGLLSRVASGVGRGWVGGSRWGAGMNVRGSNLASGRSFYRHSSRGDDSADQIERLRGEMSEDRVEMRNFYRRIANSLDPDGG